MESHKEVSQVANAIAISSENSETQASDHRDSRHQEIIEHLNTCCLCGGKLDYHHETDYIMLTVREEAHCPSCGIRTKKEAHCLQ